jgi:TolB-like protein
MKKVCVGLGFLLLMINSSVFGGGGAQAGTYWQEETPWQEEMYDQEELPEQEGMYEQEELSRQEALPRQAPSGEGLTVAVSPFEVRGGFSRDDADAVYELFVGELAASGSVRVVDRSNFDKIMAEMQFQQSDWTNGSRVAEFGKALGANSIIRGQLMSLGGKPVVTASILDINTAQILSSGSLQLNDLGELFGRMPGFVRDTVRALPKSGYAIGDRGPAGGHIFYDKGVFSNGWRYLEAASVETEFTAQWGAFQRSVSGNGTGTAIGTGKQNTQLIVQYLRRISESGRAAQRCDSLVMDSYDDWFLPSKDELNLMYQNLKRRGLGEFSSDSFYWSSSEYNINDAAWYQYFSDGSQNPNYKSETYSVRAVRAF